MGFLQVLLLILKILGLLFVSVFTLVLIAVALLLFVPLRYRLEGHKAEDYAVEARLSWLLRILRVKITYASESKLFYEVRLLWFLLLSNDEAWKAAHEEKKKQKAEKRTQKAEQKKQKQKEKRAKARAKLQKKKQKTAKLTADKAGVSGKSAPQAAGKSGADGTQARNNGAESVKAQGSGADGVQAQIGGVDSKIKNPAGFETESSEESSQQNGDEKKNWFIRICDKIKSVIAKIKNKLKAILNTVKALWHKADAVVTFLKDETNKAAFGASWSTLVQILKHIGPTKIQGYLAFGMDDPATTGYILAVLGIFYGKFGKSFSIRPNFEEKQFETELRAKGRIRMSRFVHLAWKLWRNKDFKSLLENIKQLKADIKTNGG